MKTALVHVLAVLNGSNFNAWVTEQASTCLFIDKRRCLIETKGGLWSEVIESSPRIVDAPFRAFMIPNMRLS